MDKNIDKFFSKVKFLLFIFFIFVTCYILIINNKKKFILKKIDTKRRLIDFQDEFEKDNEYIYEADKICSSISDELSQYYKTGELSHIDLDDISIECPDKDKDYMRALISIVENILSNGNNNIDDNNKDNNTNDNTDSIYNDENIYYENNDKNKKIYLNRIIPFIIFGVISLISFIGWIGCIIFSFRKSFWCNYFKKDSLFIPLYLFVLIPSIFILFFNIYGLVQTNKIFYSLSNAQCSFLKFFHIALFGEEKNEGAKWLGIKGVGNILEHLKEKLNQMRYENISSKFDDYMEKLEIKNNEFLFELKNVHKKLYKEDEITPLEGYCIDYTNNLYFIENNQGDTTTKYYLNGTYVLDIVPIFGKYNEENKSFSGYISAWNEEISEFKNNSTGSMNKLKSSFQNILIKNLEPIMNGLENGLNKLKDLIQPFQNIYNNQSKRLYKFSKKIGIIVNMVLNILFSLMILLIILLNIIFIIYKYNYCFKFEKYQKILISIIWNLLAFFMVISFLLGSAIGSIGQVGVDLTSAFSYIVSLDNFNNTKNSILINKFKKGKDILEECILREGNLSQLFELSDYIDDFNIINNNKKEIIYYIEHIKYLKANYPAYNNLKSVLANKTEFINNTELYYHNSINIDEKMLQKINFDFVLKRLNEEIGEKYYEQWDKINGEKSFECYRDKIEGLLPKNIFLHPWTCEPIDRDGMEYANINIKNYAKIASDIIDLLKYANGTKNPGIEGFHNYYEVINELKYIYNEYLNTYSNTLEFFYKNIEETINFVDGRNVSDKNTFSFLDGKFIKTNIKITLKHLKYSFGKNIYTLGIFLIVIGFELIFPISSSILLLIVLDYIKNNNNDDDKKTYISEISGENKHIKNKRFHNSIKSDLDSKSIFNKETNEKLDLNQHKNPNKYAADYLEKKIKEVQEEVKIKKLEINLIYFYEDNDNSSENYNSSNDLKLRVLGGFFCVANVDVFEDLLTKI